MSDMKNNIIAAICIGSILLSSCAKDLNLYPHDAATPDGVSLLDIPSMRIGMYNRVQSDLGQYSFIGMDFLGGDLIYSQSASPAQTIQTYMTAASGHMSGPWNGIYEALFQVNNVLYACERFTEDANATLYAGECHFFRAYLYLNLVIRYGDVPLIKTNTTDVVARSPKAEVWKFIEDEIALAEKNVTTKKGDAYFVTEDAVQALKARALLYEGKKAEAGSVAEALIKKGNYELGNLESIWGTAASRAEINQSSEVIFAFKNEQTEDGLQLGGQFFTYDYVNGGGGWWFATDAFVAGIEQGDMRKDAIYLEPKNAGMANMQYCVNKYRGGQKFYSPIPVFRIAEMYLIAAEGLGKSTGLKYLNNLRTARGLANAPASATATDDAFIEAILKERGIEFIGEGMRWYDLVRTGKFVSNFNTPEVKDYHCLFAIPQTQITITGGVLTQNPVY